MARHRSGAVTMKFQAADRIPSDIPAGSRLSYSFAASTLEDEARTVVISATLQSERWVIGIFEVGQRRVLDQSPTIARKVVGVDIEASDVPHLMRGAFRWHAFSTWVPEPTNDASEIYSDYCPEGSAVFR
jgi:hypothetical protein